MQKFQAIREQDYSRLDDNQQIYFDTTGSALFPSSIVDNHIKLLSNTVLGNPHSSNPTSHVSTALEKQARAAVLSFFNASPDVYDVIFTANASAAIKLVAESFPFARNSNLFLLADNHNSVLGIREYALRAGAHVKHLPIDHNLRAKDTNSYLGKKKYQPSKRRPSLFAYPAQSNFSGVKHPLSFVDKAISHGWYVLLDAAAYAPSNPLDLSEIQPHFVPVSFYKLFGYPTGLGALLIRKDAEQMLEKPWFAGGTVQYSSVKKKAHLLNTGHAAFEDGTINFGGIPAIKLGLDFITRVGMVNIQNQVKSLTALLLGGMLAMRTPTGGRRIRIHGPQDCVMRGGTIAFDVLDDTGKRIDARIVEQKATQRNISIRVGCFCNPGCAEKAMMVFNHLDMKCIRGKGGLGKIDENSECSSIGFLGCARISVGFYNNVRDVDLFLSFLEEFDSGDITTDASASDCTDGNSHESFESLERPTMTVTFSQLNSFK